MNHLPSEWPQVYRSVIHGCIPRLRDISTKIRCADQPVKKSVGAGGVRYRQAVVVRKAGREIPALRQGPPVADGKLVEPYRTEEATAIGNLMPESDAQRVPRSRPAESCSFCYVPLGLVHRVITEAAKPGKQKVGTMSLLAVYSGPTNPLTYM